MPLSQRRAAEFLGILEEAREAYRHAADQARVTGKAGYSHVHVSGKTRFGQWAVRCRHGRGAPPSGVRLELRDRDDRLPEQADAGCLAAVGLLRRYGIDAIVVGALR